MASTIAKLLSRSVRTRVSNVSTRPLSTAGRWKSVTSSVAYTIRNDPFVKLSLSFFVIVLGGTAAMEVYNKFKKRTCRAARVFPPSFSHYAVNRMALVKALDKELKKASVANDGSCPIVYIAGPEGSGKTQLLYQFSHYFLESHQRKWLGLKHVDPMVVYLDATSTSSFCLSVAVALRALGIKEEGTLDLNIDAMMKCLSGQQVSWLLMVDGYVHNEASESHQNVLLSHFKSCTTGFGSVLVTCTEQSPSSHTIAMPSRFEEEEAVELLSGLGRVKRCSEERELMERICFLPISTALAAATIYSYKELWHLDDHDALSVYSKILKNKLEEEQSPLQASLSVYFEVVVADARMRHVFDLLGCMDLDLPVITGLASHHIQSSFYNIPKESLMPTLPPPSVKESSDLSYWDYFKSIKEKMFPSQPLASLESMNDDRIAFLRHSPILLFNTSFFKDVELVSMHGSAMSSVRRQFTAHTAPTLDEEHCKTKEGEFQQSTWLKRYKNFNKQECLAHYHRSLPGLSSPGVLTPRQFASSHQNCLFSLETAVSESLSYSQYVHIVSHYHRVLKSLVDTLPDYIDDIPANIVQCLLIPHLQLLKEHPLLAEADKVTAQILEVDIRALSLSAAKLESHLLCYEHLVNKQKLLLGSSNLTVSSNLIKYADLLLSSGKAVEARTVLQAVLNTYKKLSSGMRDQLCVEIGHAMSSMGQAYAQLGEHKLSKDWFEYALASFQTIPEEGEVTSKQRRLISSSLVDVAQAYLILGELPVAKKYSELACMVLDSINPEGSPETIRCLKIASIVNALSGDKDESVKQKTRAAKIKGNL